MKVSFQIKKGLFDLPNIVFSNKEALLKLNQITHPIIYNKVVEIIKDLKQRNGHHYLILEAALLMEIGLNNVVDKIIGIYADEDIRIQRIMQRNNYTYKQAQDRIKNQKTWEQLKQTIDVTINNSYDIENTRKQVIELLTM